MGSPSEIELLRGIIHNVSAMLAYWDREQRCRFANAAYERWFGVKPETLIGQHIRELLGPIYALNRPYIEGALRGEAQQFEREIPDPHGGPSRHSLASYIPDICDGIVRGFYVMVTDISDVKRAQLALAASEARLSGIIAVAGEAIITLDEHDRISVFNAGAERMFGYTARELLGQSLGPLFPTGLPTTPAFETMATRKNGCEFPTEGAQSTLELGGSTVRTLVLRDITDRRRTEVEQTVLAETGRLLESSLNYGTTLTMISQLMTRHIADVCIVDMFEGEEDVVRLTVAHSDPTKSELANALAQLSLDPEHTLGARARRTRAPDVIDDITPDFIHARAQNAEHARLLLGLELRSAVVVPLLAQEQVLGMLLILSRHPHRYDERDVVLAKEIARRASLAIQNARLYEAEQRATRLRDEVLGIVAHDVRSPLNAIRLGAELVQRRIAAYDDPMCHQHLAGILRSVDRAHRLIQDLLDVSRIEAGALSLSREPLSPSLVVADLLDSQQHAAAAASITLRSTVTHGLPEVLADRSRVLQTLENLVGNALKFTPRGGSVTIAADADDDGVVFSVADTGSGIGREQQAHVFDRFWQAARSAGVGAGLGLTICKGIVEAHGGRMWVESELGRGTTFFFRLPQVRSDSVAASAVA